MGQPELAIKELERVVLPRPVFHPGSVPLFLHVNLPGDLPPQLRILERTADDLAVYRQLAELYAQQGRDADAAWAREQADILSAMLNRPMQ